MIILEIMMGLFVMGLAGLFSLILISSVFGCFGFMLFWGAMLGFFIILDISFKWLFIGIFIFYGISILLKIIRYYQMPNYDDYLSMNANTYEPGQVVCCKCGSNSISNLGLFGHYGKLRFFICTRCRSWLYRFRVL